MVSVHDIIRLGCEMGLGENTEVLDLCCGYGEMLKLWNEALNVHGVGIDRSNEFIETGLQRVNTKCVQMLTGDIFELSRAKKFDVVVCTEMSGDLFESLAEGISFLEGFAKPGGKLVFGKLFSKVKNPTQELIGFDGDLPILSEIYETAKSCGYFITAMATSTDAQWERYIMWSVKRDIEQLRKNRNNSEWIDKWCKIYFDLRRPYEGWGLFAIEKLL
jgi:ubiquinone/menaquinone biosynthesis C-methylase UbiE